MSTIRVVAVLDERQLQLLPQGSRIVLIPARNEVLAIRRALQRHINIVTDDVTLSSSNCKSSRAQWTHQRQQHHHHNHPWLPNRHWSQQLFRSTPKSPTPTKVTSRNLHRSTHLEARPRRKIVWFPERTKWSVLIRVIRCASTPTSTGAGWLAPTSLGWRTNAPNLATGVAVKVT